MRGLLQHRCCRYLFLSVHAVTLSAAVPFRAVLNRVECVVVLTYVQDHGVEMKGDESPLTKADTESNRIICEGLQRVSPHVPIISEENKTLPHAIRKVNTAALEPGWQSMCECAQQLTLCMMYCLCTAGASSTAPTQIAS